MHGQRADPAARVLFNHLARILWVYLNAEADIIAQTQRVGMLVRLLRKSIGKKVME